MNKKNDILNELCGKKIVAVLRSSNEEEAVKVAESCIKGGVDLIEITFSVPKADDVIKKIKTKLGDKCRIGAGTVLDVSTARIAIVAGAEFIVSPTFDIEVAKLCNSYFVPYIPGCMTVNEIFEATKYGVELIKLFPACQFTPNYIKNINAPLPNVKVMVTGGIDINNISEWLSAGATAIGIGGNLTTVKNGNYDFIAEVAKQYTEKIKGSISK